MNLFKRRAKLFVFFVTAFAFFALSSVPCFAENENRLFLDADEVRYEDNTGIAYADGNVRARNKDMRLYAPAAQYDSASANVTAYSDSRNDVVIISKGQKLVGKQLDYNLVTRHGVLTNAHGQMEAMYMQGSDVKVMPIKDAERLGIVKRSKKYTDDQMVAEWLGVTSTTCDFPNPHYRFVSKHVVVIPGKRTIIRRPKIYIGKFLLYTYPFDYIIRQDKKANKISPIMAYDSDKGGGFGIAGNMDFGDWGEGSIYGVYWTKGMWEAKLRYQKEITEGLTAFVESDRLYDKDDNDIMWRPKYGLHYDRNGWAYNLQMSERELIQTEMTPGQERRFNVWSKPEFRVTSPWFKDPASGAKVRLIGVYGHYQENKYIEGDWINRWALAAQLSGSFNVDWGVFKPYYGASYMYFDYDGGGQTQKVTDATIGVNWNIGSVSLNTSYFRRWVDGYSMFGWDQFADNENIYQTISFPLPIGASWEKWNLSVTGTYNMLTEKLAQVYYYLTYNKHCMTWRLMVKQDIAGEETQLGLTFYINAYPEYALEFGTEEKKNVTTRSGL